MTRHMLVKLAVGTVVAVVLAFWATSVRTPDAGAAGAGGPLVPGLRQSINEVSALRVVEAGGKTVVSLQRVEGGWQVAERAGYPADIAKVRETLIALAEANLLEAKTSNPERHAALGVEDVAGAGAKGVRVELEGKVPAKIVVGTYSAQGGATFVRRNDEAQVWLARGNLVADRQVTNWLAKEVADVGSERIMRVEIRRGDAAFAVAKVSPEQNNYQLDPMPTGRELLSEYEPNGIASVLAGLRFDDVAKADSVIPDPSSVLVATFRTFDGLVVEITGFTAEGKHYAVLKASTDADRTALAAHAAQLNAVAEHERSAKPGTSSAAAGATPAEANGKPAAVADNSPAPLAVTDPAAFEAGRRKAIEDEAAALNRRLGGWAFVLPAYKYANMDKRLEDLLKPKG